MKQVKGHRSYIDWVKEKTGWRCMSNISNRRNTNTVSVWNNGDVKYCLEDSRYYAYTDGGWAVVDYWDLVDEHGGHYEWLPPAKTKREFLSNETRELIDQYNNLVRERNRLNVLEKSRFIAFIYCIIVATLLYLIVRLL